MINGLAKFKLNSQKSRNCLELMIVLKTTRLHVLLLTLCFHNFIFYALEIKRFYSSSNCIKNANYNVTIFMQLTITFFKPI